MAKNTAKTVETPVKTGISAEDMLYQYAYEMGDELTRDAYDAACSFTESFFRIRLSDAAREFPTPEFLRARAIPELNNMKQVRDQVTPKIYNKIYDYYLDRFESIGQKRDMELSQEINREPDLPLSR